MSREVDSLLAGSALFGVLPLSERSRLASMVQRRHMKPGECAYAEGDAAHVTWFLERGRMKIAKSAMDGRPVTIEMVQPGGMFGCAACTTAGTYPCEAVSETESVAIGLPTSTFLQLIESYPKFARAVYVDMGERMREAQRLRTLGSESVERRIAGVLLWLQKKFGDDLPFTRQAVAEMAGTTPESAIRVMSRFRAQGLIDSAWKKIHVKSVSGLAKTFEEGV